MDGTDLVQNTCQWSSFDINTVNKKYFEGFAVEEQKTNRSLQLSMHKPIAPSCTLSLETLF